MIFSGKSYEDIEWPTENEWNATYVSKVGQKFGRLTILEEGRQRRTDRPGYWRYYCRCKCDCGNEKIIDRHTITSGSVKSCGCLARETSSQLSRKPDGVASFNEAYGSYKKSAKLRGYPFELTKEQFREIATQPCIYCGDVLTQSKRRESRYGTGDWWYTGIDRYDNTKGYTLENSVPCCCKCNRIKRDMDVDEMANHLEKMLERKSMWKRITIGGGIC